MVPNCLCITLIDFLRTKLLSARKGTLAIVFACERFHDFVYGHHIEILSDHMSLKLILNKPLAKSPARLQRFQLRLQRYNFTITYHQGKHMYVADTLSRAPLKDTTPEISQEDFTAFVDSVMDNLPISDNRLNQFKEETKNDLIL